MTPARQNASEPPRRSTLVAFLRGIEVRAWVFVVSQCTNEAVAEQALAHGLRDFLDHARTGPLGTWPIQFWTSLLRQPMLMVSAAPGPPLSELPPGPRAALLLRLVAGLDVVHAAEALGVGQPAYEAALRRALAHPELDEAGVQALRERLLAQIQDAPAAQRQLLATWRDEAVLEFDAPDEPDVPATTTALRHTPPRWILVSGAAGLALVLLFTVLHFRAPTRAPVIDSVAPPPAISDTIAVTHPDYLQIAAGDDEALARDLAFLSWFAAATLPPALPAPANDAPAPPTSFDALSTDMQAVLVSARDAWPDLDPPTREALLHQAHDWLARQPAEREQLRAALLTWDRLAAPERASRRTPFLAWQRLDESDRLQLRLAASRLAGLPAAEQKALRAQFAASPPDTQGLWWLGPALGQELAPFSSLFAFMPEADRPALLLALRGLDDAARRDLATLAPRLSEARRQALRRDLLAAVPEQRAALIRERLGQ